MTRHFLYIVWSMTLWTQLSMAQNPALIPQLEKELESASTDSARADILGHLAFNYASTDPKKGIEAGENGLAIAQRINNQKTIGDCYNGIGWCFFQKGDFKLAKEYLNKAMDAFKLTNDSCHVLVSHYNLGWVYQREANYSNALNEFLIALKID